MSNQFIYLCSFILIPSISILNLILFFLVIFLYIYFRRLDTSLTACWIRLCGLWHLIVRGSLLFLFISLLQYPFFIFCKLWQQPPQVKALIKWHCHRSPRLFTNDSLILYCWHFRFMWHARDFISILKNLILFYFPVYLLLSWDASLTAGWICLLVSIHHFRTNATVNCVASFENLFSILWF